MKTKEIVTSLDAGLRHKSGMAQKDFVAHYCEVFRPHAYATNDDSWNEFEKLITHALGMKMYYRRALDLLGYGGLDIREFVNELEDIEARKLEILDNANKKPR